MNVRFFILSFLTLILSGAHTPHQTSLRTGSITGRVVDAQGAPIARAKVFDAPMDSVRTGKDHFVTSDENGQFFMKDVPAGKTMVIATKLEDGYPDARFAVFSGNEVLPVIEVQADQTASGVIVKLLAKGGTVRGKIMNPRSDPAISKARLILSRVDHPEWFIETEPETEGTFEFIIPSKPMHFSVTAPGFKTWNYEDSIFSKNRTPLTLLPGSSQDLIIIIYLEPRS